ncbi:hypothetical protein [Streptomyces tibetensis]
MSCRSRSRTASNAAATVAGSAPERASALIGMDVKSFRTTALDADLEKAL